MDRKVRDNSYNNLTLQLINSTSNASNLSNITILQSTENSLVLNSASINAQLQSVANQAKAGGVSESQLYNLSPVFIFNVGDSFELGGMMFEQLPSFSNKETAISLDHYHDVTMVNNFVYGKIGSFGFRNASYVDINVIDAVNFNTALVQLPYPIDLFKDAQIIFTNDESYNLRYVSEVISHTATTIRVRIKSSSYISVGWKWQIDANNYGYTNGIYYDDFIVKTTYITGEINRGDTVIFVESTSGIGVGDKIRIQDDTLSSELNEVQLVTPPTTLTLSKSVTRTYYKTRNPQVKVLKNTFGNTHQHQIRNNEVEVQNIPVYTLTGYSPEHSHVITSYITDVSKILRIGTIMYVFGSGSKIYRSKDNGLTWDMMTDLNNFLENDIEVSSISTASLMGSRILAGASNGRIFVQSEADGSVVRLIQPEVI
jgi:hypothetical protein